MTSTSFAIEESKLDVALEIKTIPTEQEKWKG